MAVTGNKVAEFRLMAEGVVNSLSQLPRDGQISVDEAQSLELELRLIDDLLTEMLLGVESRTAYEFSASIDAISDELWKMVFGELQVQVLPAVDQFERAYARVCEASQVARFLEHPTQFGYFRGPNPEERTPTVEYRNNRRTAPYALQSNEVASSMRRVRRLSASERRRMDRRFLAAKFGTRPDDFFDASQPLNIELVVALIKSGGEIQIYEHPFFKAIEKRSSMLRSEEYYLERAVPEGRRAREAQGGIFKRAKDEIALERDEERLELVTSQLRLLGGMIDLMRGRYNQPCLQVASDPQWVADLHKRCENFNQSFQRQTRRQLTAKPRDVAPKTPHGRTRAMGRELPKPLVNQQLPTSRTSAPPMVETSFPVTARGAVAT